jgi:hypothetical protein
LDQDLSEIKTPAISQFLPYPCKCELVALVFTLVALLAAGCGGSQPDDAVRDYFAAVVEGDGERACATLTPQLRRDIDRSPAARRSGATCVEVMELAAGLNPSLSQEDVEALSVEVEEDGDQATARLRNPLVRRRETIELVKGDDGWKISTLETRPSNE